MAVTLPGMNPIRFYKMSDEPDFLTRWPTAYNQQIGNKYIEGYYPATWYKDFVINQQIDVQFQVPIGQSLTFEIYQLVDGSYTLYDTIVGIDITPTNWVSTDIYKFTWTPTEAGVYYFRLNGESVLSDKFIIHNEEKYLRRLVEIEYRNSENDYGMIFYDNELPEIDQLLYTGKTYFTGVIDFGGSNEIEGFESDRGGYEKTRSTPINTAALEIVDTPIIYSHVLNLIFSCDHLIINGIQYENEKGIEKDNIDGTDLANFKITLREKSENYLVI